MNNGVVDSILWQLSMHDGFDKWWYSLDFNKRKGIANEIYRIIPARNSILEELLDKLVESTYEYHDPGSCRIRGGECELCSALIDYMEIRHFYKWSDAYPSLYDVVYGSE